MRFVRYIMGTVLFGWIVLFPQGMWEWEQDASYSGNLTTQFNTLTYDPDPDHLWNRLFQQFYSRVSRSGKTYGLDTLDPLLWFETQYLLEGDSYQQILGLLDEFLATDAATLINDPIKRAFFQRDMWAVFDWLAMRSDEYPLERYTLQIRLAEIIQQVALSNAEIETLPDNYLDALVIFPHMYQPDQPLIAYLPPDLFDPMGPWVNIGREGGPTAITHISSLYFSGRSTFLVFIRLLDSRQSTLDYLQALQTAPDVRRAPPLPTGSQVALIRQMLVVNDQGEIISTPITLSIQLRHFGQKQDFFQFDLHRNKLFSGQAGGLEPVTAGELEFMIFQSHDVDYFELYPDEPEVYRVETLGCTACHFTYNTDVQSLISYSRDPFALPNGEQALLFETTPHRESQIIIEWKTQQTNWKHLLTFW